MFDNVNFSPWKKSLNVISILLLETSQYYTKAGSGMIWNVQFSWANTFKIYLMKTILMDLLIDITTPIGNFIDDVSNLWNFYLGILSKFATKIIVGTARKDSISYTLQMQS